MMNFPRTVGGQRCVCQCVRELRLNVVEHAEHVCRAVPDRGWIVLCYDSALFWRLLKNIAKYNFSGLCT